MGTLTNPRHERFVQALFEGETADAAYAKAGYKPNDGNCIRLKGNERVQARLLELQQAVAKKSGVTVQSLLDELEDARVKASSLEQFGTVVKAVAEKAKISGLLTTRIEIGEAGAFDACESFEDLADEMLSKMIEAFHPVDERDRQGLVDLMTRQAAETRDFLASIKARPTVTERVDPARLERPWTELLPRNGRQLTPAEQATNKRAKQQAEQRKAARFTNGGGNRY